MLACLLDAPPPPPPSPATCSCISGTDRHTQLYVPPQGCISCGSNFAISPRSQYTDTGPTRANDDPVMQDAWQGTHRSTSFEDTGMTRLGTAGIDPRISCSTGSPGPPPPPGISCSPDLLLHRISRSPRSPAPWISCSPDPPRPASPALPDLLLPRISRSPGSPAPQGLLLPGSPTSRISCSPDLLFYRISCVPDILLPRISCAPYLLFPGFPPRFSRGPRISSSGSPTHLLAPSPDTPWISCFTRISWPRISCSLDLLLPGSPAVGYRERWFVGTDRLDLSRLSPAFSPSLSCECSCSGNALLLPLSLFPRILHGPVVKVSSLSRAGGTGFNSRPNQTSNLKKRGVHAATVADTSRDGVSGITSWPSVSIL